MARVRANLAAIRTLRSLAQPASPAEKAVLARWSGWGAVPAVFDPKAAGYERFAWARDELRELLSGDEYAAAARNTINAHYTDAAYVQAIWGAVTRLGFTAGHVLEPGCGSGTFLAFAPAGSQAIGVELEPTTAKIAAALYPDAEIRSESFADTRIPDGTFDVVVGNVPFGDVTLHDRRHNPGGHRIHNHFIIKALNLTRPGGLAALITSRYTLDSANPAARREIAAVADLLGAVRLPTGAHRRAAGTDVVTDVLLLRRREADRAPSGAEFERSTQLALGGSELRINEYFAAHPEHVLGELRLNQGDGGRPELGVIGNRDASAALAQALGGIAARAAARGLVFLEGQPAPALPRPVALVESSSRKPDGYLTAQADGTFTRVVSDGEVPYEPPATQANELRRLLGLRDTAVALLEAEAASADDTEAINDLRARLNIQYDEYLGAHGPINRFGWRRTGRVDSATGEETMARATPPQGGFARWDPFARVVYALEDFDAQSQVATKASIFRQRVVAQPAPRLGADTSADALAICLDSVGEVRLPVVARLLGVDSTEARAQLGTLVFDEPGTDRLVPAAEYLSGNVRIKLAAAQAAAEMEPRFSPNVTALLGVIPRDLAPDEIDARLGAAWIDDAYIQQFLAEILEDPSIRVEHPGAGLWEVRSTFSRNIVSTTRWGTERYPAADIAQALLEQREIRIYDVDSEDKRIFNATETLAATEKAAEMSARFAEWVWEKPERAAALARAYNDRFNALVPRSYDGSKLSLPGLALSFTPRSHQVAAVARIINEPAVGLFHEVGAGKTAEMVMGAMELRRIGLASKPVVVVPNHMLEQVTREWLQLYPQAKVLAATKEDLERERRRLLVARCATGDWDGIVMTRSAFERIPMSPEVQGRYLKKEVDSLASMLERAKATDARFSVKRLEKMKLRAEERLKAKLDGAKDPGITFEQTGIDYIFVDEAHAYKNLRTPSNIPGMAVDGSQRASDLHMKLEYLRERSPRVATLATATPIANSMGEAFTMQRYLRPDLLEQAGIGDLDVWAATFGSTTTTIEVAPDGTGMRMHTRFAKFRNVPELLLQWKVSADIKTADDLELPVPALVRRDSDGERAPETVVVPPSKELAAYVADLARRADRVRSRAVDATEDNLLAISSDGRAAALDLRLVGQATAEAQKVTVAAERIAAIYKDHRADTFPGPDGNAHPRPGALQLVFADLGTPSNRGEWNVYEELRTQLVSRGVPRDSVRFIHEARNDREKGELFAACRDGRIAVLLGSTERMGTGTNVQLRAVALHHLDCPWRPADIAQREGRILRQGNANQEVGIFRYVTEGSFDAYLWQTVSRKATFISQVMRGRLDVREIEDVGEAALSYNEVKALATGNPLLLEHAQAQADVTRLERLERSHTRTQDTLRWTMRETEARFARLGGCVAAADAAIAQRDAAGDAFAMTVRGRTYAKTSEANDALRLVLLHQLATPLGKTVEVANLRGLVICATPARDGRDVTLALATVPGSDFSVPAVEVQRANLVTRLENRLGGLEALRDNAEAEAKRLRAELERGATELGKPFQQRSALEAARSRLRSLDEQLSQSATPDRQEPSPVVAEKEQASGEKLEDVWKAACRAEFASVRSRALALEKRVALRLEAQQQRLREHTNQRPEAPGLVASALGGRGRYESSLTEWSQGERALVQRERQLARRIDALREISKEPVAGYPTKGTELARARVARREPDLARKVDDYRALKKKAAADDQKRDHMAHGRHRGR